MGFSAAQWAFRLTGLPVAQLCIVQRIAWSCRDDTAFLERSTEWLANQCALSQRSLERHLPQLAKLNLVIRNEIGFRLPTFYEEAHRQNGGEVRPDRQNVRQNGGAYKEGFLGNKKRDEDEKSSSPPTPSSPEAPVREHVYADDSEIERLSQRVAAKFNLPAESARNVVLLGLLRSQARQRIQSAEYFRSLVDELRVKALPATYGQYLERKLQEFRGLVGSRSP